jgi:hypothetical protein
MTRIEALAIAAPLVAAAALGLFALVMNYLDDRATAKRAREKADANAALASDLAHELNIADHGHGRLADSPPHPARI